MPTLPTDASSDDLRWGAVATRREPAVPFAFGVVTTGVYCRPGCASRLPRRENVRFFDTPAAAAAAGFRACKRCAPDVAHDPAWPAIARTFDALERDGDAPPLGELAALAGFSRAQFHRTFVRLLGMTPNRYAALGRAERLRARLAAGEQNVLESALAGGYATSSPRLGTAPALGMTPGAVRRGGRGEDVRVGARRSSLGVVVAAMTERGVCAVELDDDEAAARERLARRFPEARVESDAALDEVLGELVDAIERPGATPRIPLDVAGTAFQRRVWHELARVAAGTTVTYGELAARIGAPGAARAVGTACASNELAIVIPCHRAVRRDGGTGDYRWGAGRKRRLLERERAAARDGPA